MSEKKKLLILGITMNSAGTEKSFLSFASCLDYEKYDVTLLLAKKEGLFLPLIPPQVTVKELPYAGDFFLLSGKNAAKTILSCFAKKHPQVLFEILPFFLQIVFSPKKRSSAAVRMWCRLMRYLPAPEEEYDAAVAYWGDRTMFYMVDRIRAKKKIAWLHFDYGHPERDDETYLHYFSACDRVVTVSQKVDEALRSHLPQIAGKCVMMENIQNPRQIWKLALTGEGFPDRNYTGRRILTIGRISEQKGLDFIPPVLKRLRADGYEVRWYIVGDGDKDEKTKLIMQAMECEVADMLILLGTTVNPYGYLRDCDYYVMTSRYEGRPITVEEAKIMWRPILVTNYLSASEQLNNGEYGLICDISEEGIYRGVRQLLDDPELCDRFTETLNRASFGNEGEMRKFTAMLEEP